MSNENGSSPAGQNGQFDQNHYPQQGHPQNGYPQNGYPNGGYPNQGYGQPGYGQQPAPAPKKNFFLRHKILTGVLALCVVGGVAAAAGGGSKNGGSSSSASTGGSAAPSASSGGADKSSGSASGDAASSGAKAPAAVGTPVRDGKFEFTVTKVERGHAVVGQQYLEQKAQGEFTLVHVTVKNIGDQQQGLSDSAQKAMDAQGTQFSADSGAAAMIQGNQVLFNQINPGNQVKGILVFDAPKGTKLTQIELHDSMFSGGVKAAL